MQSKDIEQIKSYSKLIVAELHKAVFDEAIFDNLKTVLALAEELECHIANTERFKLYSKSNVIPIRGVYEASRAR